MTAKTAIVSGLLGFVVLLWVVAAVQTCAVAGFLRRARQAEGRIVAWDYSEDSYQRRSGDRRVGTPTTGQSGRHQPIIEFTTAAGQSARFKSRLTSSSFDTGQSAVTVLYLPEDPEAAEVKHLFVQWARAIIPAAAGLVLALVAGGFWILSRP